MPTTNKGEKMKYLVTIAMLLSFSAYAQADVSAKNVIKKLESIQDRCSNVESWRASALCLDDGIESVIEFISYSKKSEPKNYRCSNASVYGKSARGGGCNVYGCYYPGGGCNVYGCYYKGGSCNVYGCINKAKKTKKACKD